MAFAAEFGRMPAQRKVLMVAIVGLLIGLVYWQLVYKALDASLADAEDQHAGKVALNQKLGKDVKDYAELKPMMSRLMAEISEDEKALPTESELPAFFDTLNRKVTESGVQVNRSQQKPEEPVESFIRVPVDFEIQGTFMQIKRFFASLVPRERRPGAAPAPSSDSGGGDSGGAVEERERIVSIENLSIGDPQVRNHEIVLTARFTAMTFRQEDKVAPPPKSAPTNATGTGATKPLPPAATPAGAKARVDGAMENSEQRGSAARLKGGL